MWQMGVRARLRLLQDDWAAAEQDARAVLAAGEFPLGRLWPHLVLGLLAARREATPDNPDLDELWRLAGSLDGPGKTAAAAAALAEQAWILRRPDPRLTDPRVAALFAGTSAQRDLSLGASLDVGAPPRARRRAGDRARRRRPGSSNAGGALRTRPRVLGRRLRRRTAGALPLLDDLGARAVAALFRGRLREMGVPASRGADPRRRARTRPGSPSASSTCWPSSWTASPTRRSPRAW